MKTNTPSSNPSPANIVRQAIESAPWYSSLVEAQEKLEALSKKRTEIEAEALALKNAEPTSIDALLAGGEIDTDHQKKMFAVNQKLGVIDDLIRQQTNTVTGLKQAVSAQANAAMRPARQTTVARMAAALAELRKAYEEDLAFFQPLLAGTGVHIDALAFLPVSEVVAQDKVWIDQRRKEGYTV